MTLQLAAPRPLARLREEHSSFLAAVSQAYPSLPPAERKVADVLRADPLEFARTSTAVIGAKAGASAPSIMRFCRAMGYSGLTQLKQALVFSLSRHDAAVLFELPPPPAPDAASALLDGAEAALTRLRAMRDSAAVADAVALLAQARHIVCIASYQLSLAALYARDDLLRHGVAATLAAASGWQAAPPDGGPAPATGLFFCQGMPDAAMLDALALCQRDGGGAVILSDVPLAAFVPANARLVLGVAPAAGALLAHCLMTDILLSGLLRRRAAAHAYAHPGGGP